MAHCRAVFTGPSHVHTMALKSSYPRLLLLAARDRHFGASRKPIRLHKFLLCLRKSILHPRFIRSSCCDVGEDHRINNGRSMQAAFSFLFVTVFGLFINFYAFISNYYRHLNRTIFRNHHSRRSLNGSNPQVIHNVDKKVSYPRGCPVSTGGSRQRMPYASAFRERTARAAGK